MKIGWGYDYAPLEQKIMDNYVLEERKRKRWIRAERRRRRRLRNQFYETIRKCTQDDWASARCSRANDGAMFAIMAITDKMSEWPHVFAPNRAAADCRAAAVRLMEGRREAIVDERR